MMIEVAAAEEDLICELHKTPIAEMARSKTEIWVWKAYKRCLSPVWTTKQPTPAKTIKRWYHVINMDVGNGVVPLHQSGFKVLSIYYNVYTICSGQTCLNVIPAQEHMFDDKETYLL